MTRLQFLIRILKQGQIEEAIAMLERWQTELDAIAEINFPEIAA